MAQIWEKNSKATLPSGKVDATKMKILYSKAFKFYGNHDDVATWHALKIIIDG